MRCKLEKFIEFKHDLNVQELHVFSPCFAFSNYFGHFHFLDLMLSQNMQNNFIKLPRYVFDLLPPRKSHKDKASRKTGLDGCFRCVIKLFCFIKSPQLRLHPCFNANSFLFRMKMSSCQPYERFSFEKQ